MSDNDNINNGTGGEPNMDTMIPSILEIGKHLINRYPNKPEGYMLIARHYINDGNDQDTIKIGIPYLKKAATMGNKVELYFNYTIACRRVKNYSDALWGIEKILVLQPKNPQYMGHKGYILYNMGQHDDGIKYIKDAITLVEETDNENRAKWTGNEIVDFVDFIKALCEYYYCIPEQVKEATRLAEFGLGLFPDKLTESLKKFLDYNYSVPFTSTAELSKNQIGEMYFLGGHQFQQKGDLHEASKEYMIACEYLPHLSVPHYAASMTLRFIGQHELALKYATMATDIDPTNMMYLSALMHLLKATCRWEEFDKRMPLVDEMIKTKNYEELADFRLSGIYWGFSMELLHKLSEDHMKTLEVPKKKQYKQLKHNLKNKKQIINKKLKIAYVSSNYRNHAQGSQLSTFFKEHDREKFEVFAISIYPAVNELATERREILKAQVEHWIDADDMEAENIAKIIKDNNIDIVIDLCGHADHTQLDIFAYRPAPVQISFLGYPGTTGAKFIDYYVGDPISTPQTMAEHFSEKLFIMPNTYQVTEHKGEHPVASFSNFSVIKDTSIVIFCNFNQPVKIEYKIFTTWMNILKNVKNSVLWLLEHTATDKMREEATKQGVDPNRLIFQKPVNKKDHLIRMQSADLLLDTTVYNAHTSAGDALWAGLPIITILGDTMPSRVCSSMVTSANFPEMIVNSVEDYENRAIYLGNNIKELRGMRKKIELARNDMKLFDTANFVKDFESGLRETWRQSVEGGKFVSFEVAKI